MRYFLSLFFLLSTPLNASGSTDRCGFEIYDDSDDSDDSEDMILFAPTVLHVVQDVPFLAERRVVGKNTILTIQHGLHQREMLVPLSPEEYTVRSYKPADSFERYLKRMLLALHQKSFECTAPDDSWGALEVQGYLSPAEKDLFACLYSGTVRERMTLFPYDLSSFKGRLNLLAYMMVAYYEEPHAFRLEQQVFELMASENHLTLQNVKLAETLLLFPLSYRRHEGEKGWISGDNEKFRENFEGFRSYQNRLQPVLSYIDLRYNIFFFEALNAALPARIKEALVLLEEDKRQAALALEAL